MQAITQNTYGRTPSDVLRLGEVDQPVIRDDEVLVRVLASSVDRGTWHVMSGLPYAIRLAGFGVRRPRILNPGRCLAGIVESVGREVTTLRPGDEVYGTGEATFAEYARARAGRVSRKPATLSFEQAAAVPVSGLTALQAVRDRARVQQGERVLVIGASGGVGTFAVQIAKAYGAEVTGVGRTEKLDLIRGLGADYVVDYTRTDITDGAPYDAILDIGGNRALNQLRKALTPYGRLVIVGGETDGRWLGGTDRQLRAQALSPLVRQTLGTFVASENTADLAALCELIEAGKVRPAIDRTYALGEAADAISHLIAGQARGKIVVAT